MKTAGILLMAVLLLLPAGALATVAAQPDADTQVAAGDTIAYTVTIESDDPDGQVHIALSKGMELEQDSVITPEGDLYFGSDGFVLIAALTSGDKIEFSAAAGDVEAVCTVTGSLEGTVRHSIASPAEEVSSQGESIQEAPQEEKPALKAWIWIGLGGLALAGGGCWSFQMISRKKKAQDLLGGGEEKSAEK